MSATGAAVQRARKCRRGRRARHGNPTNIEAIGAPLVAEHLVDDLVRMAATFGVRQLIR